MRINIYGEELPDADDNHAFQRVNKVTDTGKIYFGTRVCLRSAKELHYTDEDDDRSAVTFWGPKDKVAAILRRMADQMEKKND